MTALPAAEHAVRASTAARNVTWFQMARYGLAIPEGGGSHCRKDYSDRLWLRYRLTILLALNSAGKCLKHIYLVHFYGE